jgi:hypothetical protein
MGAFAETLDKMRSVDRDARKEAASMLMAEHGVTQADLDEGKWEIRQEGPFGYTMVTLWKKEDSVRVSIEGQARSVVSKKE